MIGGVKEVVADALEAITRIGADCASGHRNMAVLAYIDFKIVTLSAGLTINCISTNPTARLGDFACLA